MKLKCYVISISMVSVAAAADWARVCPSAVCRPAASHQQWQLEPDTKVHPKIRNHGEGPIEQLGNHPTEFESRNIL